MLNFGASKPRVKGGPGPPGPPLDPHLEMSVKYIELASDPQLNWLPKGCLNGMYEGGMS